MDPRPNPTRLGRAQRSSPRSTPRAILAGDDTLSRGVDSALSVAVFFGLGVLLDRWLGVSPLFTIAMVALAMVGSGLRIKYSYDRNMERHERERAEATRGVAS
jgi:F0F1-type ATP synthase assembly protein I